MGYYQFRITPLKGKIYTSTKFEAENILEAIRIRDEFLKNHEEYTIVRKIEWMEKRESGRGGRREGAGRPEGTVRSQTKVVRVPAEINIEKLLTLREDLITLIEAQKKEIHPTSPRDERARELIEEIESIL